MKFVAKFIAAVFIFALLLTALAAPAAVKAQQAVRPSECDDATYAAQNPATCNVEIGGVNYTIPAIRAAINSPTPNLANTTAYVFYTILAITTGTFNPNHEPAGDPPTQEDPSPEPPRQNGSRPSSLPQALNDRGLIGGGAFMLAELISNQPASAQVYVADLFQNSRLTGSPVYAQGIGFGALSPILGTWKAFRDVAYYLLAVAFFVTGILILIRHKISGNVAVTVQAALPRLVITLILITFSYAIAGLVVDLMYLSLYFIIGIFERDIFDTTAVDQGFTLFGLDTGAGGFGLSHRNLREIAFDTNIFFFTLGYILNNTDTSAWNAASSLGNMVYNAFRSIPILGQILEAPVLSELFQAIIDIIFTLVFGIALLIAMFRTFFSLLMSYAGFVINVVLSPFILLPAAIPGKGDGVFMKWFRNLLGGLAPFVVTVFMIFMSLALTGSQTQPGIGYDPENPGDSGLRLPLVMGRDIDASAFIGILGMAFMLLMPEAVKMTKKMVGASGGPFDELKDTALNNFKQGWAGNKYIPGAKGIVKGAAKTAGAGLGGAVVGGAAGGLLGGIGGGKAAYQSMRDKGYGKAGSLTAAIPLGLGAAGGNLIGGAAIGGTIGAAAYPTAKVGGKVIGKAKKLYTGAKEIDAQTATAQAAWRHILAKRNAHLKSQVPKGQTPRETNTMTQDID